MQLFCEVISLKVAKLDKANVSQRSTGIGLKDSYS